MHFCTLVYSFVGFFSSQTKTNIIATNIQYGGWINDKVRVFRICDWKPINRVYIKVVSKIQVVKFENQLRNINFK